MIDVMKRWVKGHAMFFISLEKLILVHSRLVEALEREDYHEANVCLYQAADDFRSALAAMRLATDMSHEVYSDIVRPTMEHPKVPQGFSGTFGADHIRLLRLRQQVGKALPSDLSPVLDALEGYWSASDAMFKGHAGVCSHAVGEAPSLRMMAVASPADDSGPEDLRGKFRRRFLATAGYGPDVASGAVSLQVSEEVFSHFAHYRRSVVALGGVRNLDSDQRVEAWLREAAEGARHASRQAASGTTLWEDAWRRTGQNPNRFPPAHLNLIKRLAKPSFDPPFINTLVALMNVVSLRYSIPVGGDDLRRALRHGDSLVLRPTQGGDTFEPLGAEGNVEHPEPGEWVYASGNVVMCRRWVWRNSHTTRITLNTDSVVVNFDALGDDAEAVVDRAAKDFISMVRSSLPVDAAEQALLTPDSPNAVIVPW